MKTALAKSHFDDKPHTGYKVSDSTCPIGLVENQTVYLEEGTKFCGEQPLPKGTPVVFIGYVYSKPVWYRIALWKYALFQFPDGSERSLMKGSFTIKKPKSSLFNKILSWLKNLKS